MYKLFTDGGSRGNPGPAACAAYLFADESGMITFDGKYLGSQTNNVAEYEGLIVGLKLANKSGIQELIVCMDSELIVNQIKGKYKVKDENMKNLHEKACAELEHFTRYEFMHVPRAENKHADKLVNLILDAATAKSSVV